MIDPSKWDTNGDGQVRKPDPSKWEKPHDYGEGKHAGELEQDDTRLGDRVTPWGPDYHNGVMARLIVDENGTASGHLSSNLAFMRLRAQQDSVCPLEDGEIGDAQDTTTSLWVQHGPRRLWDKIEKAHASWVQHDRPGCTRLGITVTNTEQWAWLDHPDQRIAG